MQTYSPVCIHLLEHQQLVLKVSTLSFPFMIYICSHLNNDSQGKMRLQLVWVQCLSIRHTCGVWHPDTRRLSGGM